MAQAPGYVRRPWLLFAVRTSLAGITGSVVLFGFTPETRTLFYVTLASSLLLYVFARGAPLVRSVGEYLSSRTLAWRWAFLVWTVVSLAWASRAPSVDRVVTLIEIHAVGLVVYDACRRLDQLGWILNAVLVAAALGAAHALFTDQGFGASRLEGMYRNPNLMAVTLIMGLAAFSAGAGVGRTAGGRVAAHALALVILAGIAGTASLKGVLGVACVWSIGCTLRETRRRVMTHIMAAAAAAAVALPWAMAMRAYWERTLYRVAITFSAVFSQAGVSNSLVERVRFVRKGLALIAEAPLRGRGADSFSWLSGEGTYAHSNVIEVGVAFGLVGLILYYTLHAAVMYKALSLRSWATLGTRFVVILVPTLVLLDLAAVSYVMKLPTLLLILSAGWVELQESGPRDG